MKDSTSLFRQAVAEDFPSLVRMADETGVFEPDEARSLLGGILEELREKKLGEGHEVTVLADKETNAAKGWVYFAPSFKTDRVWDLWWIGVSPNYQKEGVGGLLLKFVEDKVKESGGRILIIETSTADTLKKARKFYLNRGYTNCGTIPDFYADGEGKITFVKRVDK